MRKSWSLLILVLAPLTSQASLQVEVCQSSKDSSLRAQLIKSDSMAESQSETLLIQTQNGQDLIVGSDWCDSPEQVAKSNAIGPIQELAEKAEASNQKDGNPEIVTQLCVFVTSDNGDGVLLTIKENMTNVGTVQVFKRSADVYQYDSEANKLIQKPSLDECQAFGNY